MYVRLGHKLSGNTYIDYGTESNISDLL